MSRKSNKVKHKTRKRYSRKKYIKRSTINKYSKKRYNRKKYSKKRYNRKKYSKKRYNRKKRYSKREKEIRKKIMNGGVCEISCEGDVKTSICLPTAGYSQLLTHNGYYSAKNANNFLVKNIIGGTLDNFKEIRIASFTNYYRCAIYSLVNIINDYLEPYADVVVSGGDGLNRILLSAEYRPISPDIDVKVIIKGISDINANWLDIYKYVVVRTEYIVDYIVCCLNDGVWTHKEGYDAMGINDPGPMYDCKAIQCLFYVDDASASARRIFRINQNHGDIRPTEFNRLLEYNIGVGGNWCDNEKGCPWARRTSNMKAGNPKPPYTLMNVKLIAIDLRYVNCVYFSSLAGVLDIVIAVPGHIGHNGMKVVEEPTYEGYILKEYFVDEHCFKCNALKVESPLNSSVFNITLVYYIKEMIKMIQYCLRTKNGKVIKDLNRYYVLLNVLKDEDLIKLIAEGKELLDAVEICKKDLPPVHLSSFHSIIDKIKWTLANGVIKEALDFMIDAISEMNLPLLQTEQDYAPEDEVEVIDCDDESEGGHCGGSGGNPATYCGWKSINSESIGKCFESLNIMDFFGACERLIPDEIGYKIVVDSYRILVDSFIVDYKYFITLNIHNKIAKNHPTSATDEPLPEDIASNFVEQDLVNGDKTHIQGRRIDYEELSSSGKTVDAYHTELLQSVNKVFDLLCREPYMLYTYKYPDTGLKKMNLIFPDDVPPTENYPKKKGEEIYPQFDTTRITICPTQARVAGDVLNTIAFILTRENIHHLSQFRHFSYPIPAEVGIPVEGVVPVHKIHAAFILSSVIPGMDVEKLRATKKNFKGLHPEINFQYLIEAIQKFTEAVKSILKH